MMSSGFSSAMSTPSIGPIVSAPFNQPMYRDLAYPNMQMPSMNQRDMPYTYGFPSNAWYPFPKSDEDGNDRWGEWNENRSAWNQGPAFQDEDDEDTDIEVENKKRGGRTAAEARMYETLLLLPFLVFPESEAAAYFVVTELIGEMLGRVGVSNVTNLLISLLVSTLDFGSLAKGEFKVLPGFKRNFFLELYDCVAGLTGASDAVRLGSQILLEQKSS